MTPKSPLPLPDEWEDVDAYVESLLSFATSSDLFRNLCGGVHILDCLTREPDVYATIIPEDWRAFCLHHEIGDILDLLLREDVEPLRNGVSTNRTYTWIGGLVVPQSLVEYIHDIRRHCLRRDFESGLPGSKRSVGTIPVNTAVGRKQKKCH